MLLHFAFCAVTCIPICILLDYDMALIHIIICTQIIGTRISGFLFRIAYIYTTVDLIVDQDQQINFSNYYLF